MAEQRRSFMILKLGEKARARVIETEKPKKRECLRCEKHFLSVSPINRICPECKGSEVFKYE